VKRASVNLSRGAISAEIVAHLDAAEPEQARDLLYAVVQRFIDGFGTADLRHAQTVLDQLA
jgi:hypothetical protein